MKKKIVITSLAFAAMALGIGSSVALRGGTTKVNAVNEISIGTTSEFVAAFNGSTEKAAYNINLTADIDLSSVAFSAGGNKMAGDYTGTFNGNGHKIYGYSVPNDASLWNNIGAAGIVENTVFEATITSSAARPISFNNSGTIKNCSAILTIGGAINSVGAFAYGASTGSFINDVTSYVYDGSHDGNTFAALCFNGVSGTVTSCYYSLPEIYLAGGFRENGATSLTKGAKGGIVAADSDNIPLGSSATVEGMPYGSPYDSVVWTQSGAGAVTIESGSSTNLVTVTGSTAGSVTLTATYTKGTTTFTAAKVFTVLSSTPVSAITLSAASSSIYKGKTTTVTATLTGTEYDHIAWESSSAATATVSGSGVTATVTGIAAGSVTITATVYDSSSTILATNTCDITVNNPTVIPVYVLESKVTTDKTAFVSNVYLFPYGELDSTTIAMTKVASNSQDVKFRMTNTSNNNIMDSWQLWYAEIDISGKTMAYTNACVQINFSTNGRWGSGYQITSAAGAVFACGYHSGDPYAALSWAQADLKAAVTHSASTIYSGAWRDSNSSICYLSQAANVATLKTYYDSYAALSSNVKTIADAFDDSTTAYNATYGETMAMLQKYYPSGAGSNSVQAVESKDNAALIAAIAAMGILALGAGAFVIARKKQH